MDEDELPLQDFVMDHIDETLSAANGARRPL